MASGFLLGRSPGRLVAPYSGEDFVFAGERIDGTEIRNGEYAHCTFANISFKQAEIRESRFRDCVFIDCYFRETRLIDSAFTSCRFIRCSFPKTEVRGSDFRYAGFEECFVRFAEIRPNLPKEHNLREQLATNLEHAALDLLETKEAGRFRQEAIEAKESHLKEAVRASSSYYKQHYDGWGRAIACVQLVASLLSGQLWGHGERWTRLARNFFLMALIVFPAIYLALGSQLQTSSGETPSPIAILLLSLDRMLLAGNVPNISAVTPLAQAIFVMESAAGIVLVGLFVAMLLKAIAKR